METQLDRGILVSGNVVIRTLVGSLNAAIIFQASNFAQQVGTKSFKPRMLRVRNNAGGDQWLNLGTGVGPGFAPAFPPVRVINVMDSVWQRVELPERELFADMTAYPDALIVGGSLDVQVEVEEIG